MVTIEAEDFFPEPLQVIHPIISWEIQKEGDFTPSWKITRLGGETFSYIQFEDLIRSCDRDDLDTLRRMVNERQMAGLLQDEKEKDLWVQFQRLYESNASDRY